MEFFQIIFETLKVASKNPLETTLAGISGIIVCWLTLSNRLFRKKVYFWQTKNDSNAAENLKELEGRIDQALKGNRVWYRQTNQEVVEFVPLSERKYPIISVFNMKGGVGKTTIAANLGAYLVENENKEVLFVDLDYQQTLTDVALGSGFESSDSKADSRSLLSKDPIEKKIFQKIQNLKGGTGWIIPAENDLASEEDKLLLEWIVGRQRDDVRYRMRRHLQQLKMPVGAVIIDCPPRLTAGTVNALCASDYVIVPAILDYASLRSVTLVLNTLRNYRHVWPNLEVRGIIGNEKSGRRDPTEWWNSTKEDNPTHKNNFIQPWIKQSTIFATAIANGQFAIQRDAGIKENFGELISTMNLFNESK